MKKIIQGVMNTIQFPLGQDEIAIGRAINSLLKEGWKFCYLTKTEIALTRKWEVSENETKPLVAIKPTKPLIKETQ